VRLLLSTELRDFFQDRFGAYGFTKTGKKLKLNKPPFPTRTAAQESDSYKATEFKLNWCALPDRCFANA